MSLIDKSNNPIEIFYSYSHKDEKLRSKIETHLSLLKQQGLVIDWHDRKINAGKELQREINNYINTAQIILLLVSPDFLASEYLYSIEMKRAMERHEAGACYVIPIILRPVAWENTAFSKLRILPTNGVPVTSWSNRDKAFLDIAQGIEKVVKELLYDDEIATQAKLLLDSAQEQEDSLAKAHILVIDDDEHSNVLLRFVLEKEGYIVSTECNPQTALKRIENEELDLILLDVNMPYMDGFAFLAKLRAKGNKAVVIMVTARDQVTDKIYGFKLGTDDYITKPFNHEELALRVKACLRRKKSAG